MKKNILAQALLITGAFAIILTLNFKPGKEKKKFEEDEKEALTALQFLTASRAYPQSDIAPDAYSAAIQYFTNFNSSANTKVSSSPWQNIGPDNIGGRTLCVAIDPNDTSVVWLGSASGGLWKSNSGGIGTNAWTNINIGVPVLGVSSIAIDPSNSNVMYIGTGETYNYGTSQNGIAIRTTRGSHGMGILKSTDGGQSWNYSLNWSYQQQRGIWEVIINPLNSNVVYAATTEGVYKSTDAGGTWNAILNVQMCMDLEIDIQDTSILYVGAGNLNTATKGVYKTSNAGATWTLLNNGIPINGHQGRTWVTTYPKNTNVVCAVINDDFATTGTYISTDKGQSWTNVNSTSDIAGYQGWYAKGILMHPLDSSMMISGGIEMHKSFDQGANFYQVSNQNWVTDYVHPDIHDIVCNPKNPDKIYVATDGGLFRSDDFGDTFYECTSGYVTSQFYIGSVSSSDPQVGLGGLQDNFTLQYTGSSSWTPVVGGDGCFNAIDPTDDNNQFASYQYMNIFKSQDKGSSFFQVYQHPVATAFVSPFVICPSNPAVMYAGAKHMLKSTDAGFTWSQVGPTSLAYGSFVLTIGVSHTTTDTLYLGLEPWGPYPAKIFRSDNGGSNYVNVTGTLPNRYPRDIAVNPKRTSTAYVVFSGFGTGHVFRTDNYGGSWTDLSTTLPDLPFHSVTVDPFDTNRIFAGSDFGVFESPDRGITWSPLNTGMPMASMVFDLVISPSDTSLLAFTHGNGAYKTKLAETFVGIKNGGSHHQNSLTVFPSLATEQITIKIDGDAKENSIISVYAVSGSLVRRQRLTTKECVMNIEDLSSGIYILNVENGDRKMSRRFVKQ